MRTRWEWAAAPQVALGYALLAVVLVLISLIQRNQPAVPMTDPESVGMPDGEPVPVTEHPDSKHPDSKPATNQTATAPDPATV